MSKAEKLLNLMMNEAASDGEVLNARRMLIRELKSLNESLSIGGKTYDTYRLNRENDLLRKEHENYLLRKENTNLKSEINNLKSDYASLSFKYKSSMMDMASLKLKVESAIYERNKAIKHGQTLVKAIEVVICIAVIFFIIMVIGWVMK